MDATERARQVRRRLQQRWHNIKRKDLKHETISLAPKWLSDFERFVHDLQNLPGYDEEKLLACELTLIRVNSEQFNNRTCMWLPTTIPTISGFSVFIVATQKGKRCVIVNEERFAKEELGASYHVLRRVLDGRRHKTIVSSDWTFKRQSFTRNTLAAALAANELYL